MAERPLIPMSGQSPDSSGGTNAGASSHTSHHLPASTPSSVTPKSMATRAKLPFIAFRRRVKKNPAVWLPVITVATLLVVGLIAGEIDSPTVNRPNSIPPSTVEGVSPRVTGTINDLIVHSIVSIVVYEDGTPCSGGSGSVVGDGLHILTNHHVVATDEDCQIDEIRVQTVKNSGDLPEDSFFASVLASDEDMDLAILKLRPITDDAPVLRPLQLTTTNTVGQDIVVVGFPAVGGDSVTVSKGIISGFAFLYGSQWIKTDAAISGGNSGGAALDLNYRLVGIPTMLSQTSDGRGIDCRKAADTNGDGVINEKDTCVGVGGSFALMAKSETAIKFASSHGLNISGPQVPATATTVSVE